MGHKSTKPQVMAYLIDHPNKTLTIENMARDLKLTHTQIQHQMTKLRGDGAAINVIIRGRIWTYTPDAVQPEVVEQESLKSKSFTDSLWECIGITKKGLPILKDENGMLYVAQELDI